VELSLTCCITSARTVTFALVTDQILLHKTVLICISNIQACIIAYVYKLNISSVVMTTLPLVHRSKTDKLLCFNTEITEPVITETIDNLRHINVINNNNNNMKTMNNNLSCYALSVSATNTMQM